MLITRSVAVPISPNRLRATLASVLRAYDNCEYTQLTTPLPHLITNGRATDSTTGTVLAETYTLITGLAIELDD